MNDDEALNLLRLLRLYVTEYREVEDMRITEVAGDLFESLDVRHTPLGRLYVSEINNALSVRS